MLCSWCGHNTTRVTQTRCCGSGEDAYVWRRRECLRCHRRFTTYECYERGDPEAALELAELKVKLHGSALV